MWARNLKQKNTLHSCGTYVRSCLSASPEPMEGSIGPGLGWGSGGGSCKFIDCMADAFFLQNDSKNFDYFDDRGRCSKHQIVFDSPGQMSFTSRVCVFYRGFQAQGRPWPSLRTVWQGWVRRVVTNKGAGGPF